MMYGNGMRRAVAVACVAAVLMISAPMSWGAPGDEEGEAAAANSATLTWSDVGAEPALAFYGLHGTQQLTLPVPPGLRPDTLNAFLELPVYPRPGTLTVTQDERTISRVPLPDVENGPIVIPLAGAEVVDNWVTLVLRTYLLPEVDYCIDPTNPLRLVDGSVTYTGVAQPAETVADFLPPVLRKLTIHVPQSPSQAESDAAVQLAAGAAAHYGNQDPEITAAPFTRSGPTLPAPPGPVERHIVVKEGPQSTLSVKGPPNGRWLQISGPADRLTEQTRLLFSEIATLAIAPNAVVRNLSKDPSTLRTTTTIRDLGQPSANSLALAPKVSVRLDQTRLGGPVHAMRVHLLGWHTPVRDDFGGQLVASVAGQTIDRWPADHDGAVDRWIDIPDRLLARSTNLEVSLNVADNTGRCGDFHTAGAGDRLLSLTIDGDTAVQSTSADPPVPGGLQSVPQALMPRVQVGIGSDTLGDTTRAVALIVGLQRLSALPIETEVMGARQVLDSSDPGIVIAADGWDHSDVDLPLAATPDGPITFNGLDSDGNATTLGLDPTQRFASIQTVFDDGRTLLVATSNGAPAKLNGLLDWLNRDSERWSKLRGVAVVTTTPERDPVTVDIGGSAQPEPEIRPDISWVWWMGGGLLTVCLIALAAATARRRRLTAES